MSGMDNPSAIGTAAAIAVGKFEVPKCRRCAGDWEARTKPQPILLMKKMNLLLAAVLASAAWFSSSAFAKPIDGCSTGNDVKATLPVPTKVVQFKDLSRKYENATVAVTMTIDAAGVPHDVKPAGNMPRELIAVVVPMVQQWRFRPSYVNGQAVPARVVLPLQLVEG
jgi:hypothetical protein